MKNRLPSLKLQLFIGYFIFIVFILLILFIFWKFSVEMEKEVQYGEKISEFLENILEMRRYEKNYFLYHHRSDLENLEKYFLISKNLFNSLKSQLVKLINKKELETLEEKFILYEKTLSSLKNLNPSSNYSLKKEELRKYGNEILKLAEFIKNKEKNILINFIHSAKNLFLFFGIFLSLLSLTGLLLGYKSLIKSLDLLGAEIKNIFSGKSKEILVPSEFQHFIDTFKKTYFTLLESEKISSLGKLLFSVVHELNNPLSNISTSLELLKSEEVDEKFKKELLNDLENEVERIKSIISSVLDFHKKKDKTFVNLHSCINETIYLLKGYIPAKISLNLDIPEDIKIWGNKSQIQQIFINLVKNAVEAMEDEGEIEIKAFREKDKIKIIVKDTGKGIPKKYLSRIFEPFFSTKESVGHGIGLFITYKLIKEHEGNIWVESEENKGTTFYIEFPLKTLKNVMEDEVYGSA